MHSVVATSPSHDARHGSNAALAQRLRQVRAELLAAHAGFAPAHAWVPMRFEFNLPLWELGHVAWFAERWCLRQPDRALGERADPTLPLPCGRLRDDWYDSSAVPHASRWQLPLPDRVATQALLAEQLQASLQALASQAHTDAALYPFRLSLLHEAMHVEAAHLMARQLGLPSPSVALRPGPVPAEISIAAQQVFLGSESTAAGFAFDNERPGLMREVDAFRVDAQVRRWRDLLPWLRNPKAWADERLWSPQGQAWRRAQAPRDLDSLNPDAPAEPLSAFEAEAWCAWAGRCLLSEAQWQAAALYPAFEWGEVWEWTSEPFAPYPGFAAHPYRDYSAPWFDDQHRLLRGASRFTPSVLRHQGFRNFYPPGRTGLVAGLRSRCTGP